MFAAHDASVARAPTPSRFNFSSALASVLSSRIHQFRNFLGSFSCVRNTTDEVETVHRPAVSTRTENFRAHITADTLIQISYNCMTKDSSHSFLNRLHTLADMPDPIAALEEALASKGKGLQDVRRDVMASLSALTNIERCADNTEDIKALINIAKDIQTLASNFDKKYAWLSNPTAFISNNSLDQKEKISFVADFSQQMRDLKIKLELYLEKKANQDSGYSSPNEYRSPNESRCITINNSLASIHEYQENKV